MSHDDSYEHQDALSFLNEKAPLKDKLISAHQLVQKNLPFIARIALTLYDPSTGLLKTYMHSSGEDNPLEHYQAPLDNAASLKEVLDRGRPRVINNMLTFENSSSTHNKRLGRQGYAASYTLPMFNSGDFVGFLFFNSYESEVFTETVLQQLDTYGHLISLMVVNELTAIDTLSAAVKTTGQLTHLRDPETGSHLDRMSRYSRLIAQTLADQYDLDDDYIEHVFMFSPLHDIGKIAIPDSILLKPDRLTEQEMAVMQTHPLRGSEIIEELIENFGLNRIGHVEMLRNIAAFHHEKVNGSGYPHGKQGQDIPLEARIVAVADIFDALTSKRPYKEAWTNDKAFDLLRSLVGEQLDSDCVEALVQRRSDVELIQKRFKEDSLG